MTDPITLPVLQLADQADARLEAEARRRNSAYDYYGTDNTPGSVDPLVFAMAAELRRLHAEVVQLKQARKPLSEEQIRRARELAASMKHSAGAWMVPGWDGYRVAELIEGLLAHGITSGGT